MLGGILFIFTFSVATCPKAHCHALHTSAFFPKRSPSRVLAHHLTLTSHSLDKSLLSTYCAQKMSEIQLSKALVLFTPSTNPRHHLSFQSVRVCQQSRVTTGLYFQLYHHLNACNINHSTLEHLFSKEVPRGPQASLYLESSYRLWGK